jgi:hypothetical protein
MKIATKTTPQVEGVTIKELIKGLARRHETRLFWRETRPALSIDAAATEGFLRLSASLHDCINMQRYAEPMAEKYPYEGDINYLLDFIAIKKARFEEQQTQE